MSVNTAHANRGVLLHTGENILLHCKIIGIEFPNQLSQVFRGMKPGYLYLTSHRMIFRSKRQTELLQSLSAPFVAIDDISVHKDSTNSAICGKVRAQPNGNFNGQIEFKLLFKSNEAVVKFANILLCLISMTLRSDVNRLLLSPYKPPGGWYEAPLEVHKPPTFFKKWLPTNDDLFQSPAPNSVFMSNNYPPFPGIYTTDESKLNCIKNLMPWKNVKFPTPTESFDGFIQPPMYGVVKCVNMDGGDFPHQAADSLTVHKTSELPSQI